MIGLSNRDAKKFLEMYGSNELTSSKRVSPALIFLSQFNDLTIYILLFSVFLSLLIKDYISGSIIVFIVVIISIFGFFQEYSSEKAMEELENMIVPEIMVYRDGIKEKLNVKKLVPGDVIELKQGDLVPADCLVLKTKKFSVNESAITGESIDVFKKPTNLNYSEFYFKLKQGHFDFDDTNSLTDSFLYAGSSVSLGKALAVVIRTGKHTEFGKIAKHLAEKEDKSVFREKIEILTKKVSFVIMITIGILFIFRLFQIGFNYNNLVTTLIFSIALAVAAIPEGLPIVVTITFALSSKRMAEKNAIIRKLSVIDGLGSTTTICTDKTGTLTKNQLEIKTVYFPNFYGSYHLENDSELLECFNFSHDADEVIKKGKHEIVGSSVDVAIKRYLDKINYKFDHGQDNVKLIEQIPFDAVHKYSINVFNINHEKISFIKGAPEKILAMANYIRVPISNGQFKVVKKNKLFEKELSNKIDSFAEEGYHTIGFAKITDGRVVFIALIGMQDEIREEVRDAIKTCYDAGINVIVVTGDHLKTAIKIAKDAGIKVKKYLTGDQISNMSITELENEIKDVTICARVEPDDKYKIVQALKNNGEIVAMTGDGINDAPALKKADVGIAVGSGTEIAIQASDMVIKDNNFATIIEAVKEGRNVFFNLRKYLAFQFSINFAEIFLLLLSILLDLPNPVNALQLLFINIVLDDITGISLTQLAPNKNVIKYKPSKELLSKPLPQLIFIFGTLMAIFSLIAYFIGSRISVRVAQNFTFLTLSYLGVLRALSYSDLRTTFFKATLKNKVLTLNSILALCFIMFVYILFFLTSSFPPIFYLYLLIMILIVILLMDITKRYYLKDSEFV